jgi:hypothetical protein
MVGFLIDAGYGLAIHDVSESVVNSHVAIDAGAMSSSAAVRENA